MSTYRLISRYMIGILLVALLTSCRSSGNPTSVPKGIQTDLPQTPKPTYALMIPFISQPGSGQSCSTPAGWSPTKVQNGDTLESFVSTYNTTINELMQANCLVTDKLVPGTILYVPGIAPTETTTPCGPPPEWVQYTVQAGDTLYQLSLYYGVSVAELQVANCMGSSTIIRTGQVLFVPQTPTQPP